MNCQNCGAALEPVGGRNYFRCEYCGAFEFPETTESGITELHEASPYSCPVCVQPLSRAVFHGYPIFTCSQCRGFLTTNANFTHLLSRRRQEPTATSATPPPFQKNELHRRVKCPGCQKRMDTHPYGGGGNVVVDTCYHCQLIWFDAGEFDILARHRPVLRTQDHPSERSQPNDEVPSNDVPSRIRGDRAPEDATQNPPTLWDILKRLF